MKLVPVDRYEVPDRRSDAKWHRIAREFLASGAEAARLELDEGAKPDNCSMALRHAVKAAKLPVAVFLRRGNVYLERTDLNGAAAEEPAP